MRLIITTLASLLGVSIGSPSCAKSILLHQSGEVGDRKAYFTEMNVTDRTAPSLEPRQIEIKELAVTIIYENAQMPELAHLNLQFECASEFYYAFHNRIPPTRAAWAPVKTRLASGSMILRRTDLKTEPVPQGAWEVSSELAMLKASQLACNAPKINQVVRASVVNDRFIRKTFEEKLPSLGLETLTNGILVTDLSLWTEFIDLTWKTLWPNGRHPDPSGKWSRSSTPQEVTEFQRTLNSASAQIAQISETTRRAYEPRIQETQHRLAFDASATQLRRGRTLRPYESTMLQVWQGKTENDVTSAMGPARFRDQGQLHSLSYSQVFDNRVTVGSSNGEVWQEGLYTNCSVEFITLADNGGVYRVADIALTIDSSNIMATNSHLACGYLKVVPLK